jgi:hypothetical protein
VRNALCRGRQRVARGDGVDGDPSSFS